MSKWKYNLGHLGIDLRESINSDCESIDCCRAIVENLFSCYDYLKGELPSYEFLRWFQGDLDSLLEVKAELEEDDVPYWYGEDLVNERLEAFYDSCDACRVWIGI